MLLRKFTLSALTFAVVLAFTPLFAAPQSEAAEAECGAGSVEPGQTKTTPNGVTIENYGRPNELGIYYWYEPASGNTPAHLWVSVPANGHARISQPKHGDEITVGDHAHVEVTCDNFKDSGPSSGHEVGRGGINVEGDSAHVVVFGSNNDVDFKSGTQNGEVEFHGSGNDVDLNGTNNSVTPTAGQNIHN